MFANYEYQNLPDDKLKLINNLWEELKVDSASFGGEIYIICGVLVVGLVVFFVYRYIVKRKRRRLYW